MAVREILLLGNHFLYKKCSDILTVEKPFIKDSVADLHDTLVAFRNKHGVGRAIAAPQIGIGKRLIYMYIDKPVIFINPVYEFLSDEMFDVWDDCMSFPNLLVKVERYKKIRLKYYDDALIEQHIELNDALSELLQHEMDHLDGILAVMRAKDKFSFKYKD